MTSPASKKISKTPQAKPKTITISYEDLLQKYVHTPKLFDQAKLLEEIVPCSDKDAHRIHRIFEVFKDDKENMEKLSILVLFIWALRLERPTLVSAFRFKKQVAEVITNFRRFWNLLDIRTIEAESLLQEYKDSTSRDFKCKKETLNLIYAYFSKMSE